MPFVVPTLSDAFGSRAGNTILFGTLAPTQGFDASGAFVSRLSASIAAGPPLGLFTTTQSWGFAAGFATPGTTSLTVTASGTTRERAEAWTLGGYSSATAEISVTVEEFRLVRVAGMGKRPGFRLAFQQSVTSSPTAIFNLTNWVAGFQPNYTRDATAATVLVMPITPPRFYRCWINSVQSAGCSGGISGLGNALSNFTFDIGSVFFSFT
jgi:hypothetical protein